MFGAVQRPEIFVAQTEIKVKPAGYLYRVLPEEVKTVNPDEAFRISHGDRGGRNVAGQEISQGTSGVGTRTSSCPGSLSSIEGEFSGSTPVIELIHASLPDLTSETELMPAHVVGNDVGQHPSDVIPAFRGREANLLKAGATIRTRYDNIRGAQDGLSLNRRIRAQEQAQGLGIEAVVGVAEGLVEIVDSEKQLIRHSRRENGVQRGRVVVDVDRSLLEVILQVRTGRSQGRAAAQRGGLTALPAKPADGKPVFLGEVVIDFGYAVVAVSSRGNRTEEVAGCCREIS